MITLSFVNVQYAQTEGGSVHSQKCLHTYVHLKTAQKIARNKMAASITVFNALTWLMQPLVDATSSPLWFVVPSHTVGVRLGSIREVSTRAPTRWERTGSDASIGVRLLTKVASLIASWLHASIWVVQKG